MKRQILLFCLCALFSSSTLFARTLYFHPGGASFWEQSGAQFAAWHWTNGGADGAFTPFMSLDPLSGYYSFEVSDTDNRLIFLRFASTATSPAWTDSLIWNKTDDIILDTLNLFTITSWGSGLGANCEGTWSRYIVPTVDPDTIPTIDPDTIPTVDPDTVPSTPEPFVPSQPNLPSDHTSAVPSACPDVMLQAFYWGSYESTAKHGDTRWTTLLGQTSEINAYFDLVWLPPSAKSSGGVGYHPAQYSNQNSTWGSRAQLEQLISAFHAGGTKVIADIVINHAANKSTWCDFYPQDFGQYGYFAPTASWICSSDEVNSDADAGSCKGKATGSRDDGYGSEANYAAARDWDHQSEQVRDMFRAYAQWMKHEMKYDGFRYDYCKGFHASHINDYNSAAQTYFSVMEYWDGNASTLAARIQDAGNNSLAFDFATKYTAFNNNLSSGSYAGMKGSGLLGKGKSKYAVTFVDNHDTYQRDGNEFCGKGKSMTTANRPKTIQANAFLLSMPGIPCIFYPHWVEYKAEIAPMILARKAVGVHSESTVNDEGDASGYRATVYGTNGHLVLELGNRVSSQKQGYTLAASGTGYAIWTQTTQAVAPQLIVSQSSCVYKTDSLLITLQTVGGTEPNATIYYTLDGTDPRTSMTRLTYTASLCLRGNVTLTAYAVTANTQSPVVQYTYTYKAPQTTPIVISFYKPAAWAKVNLYAWVKEGTKTTQLTGKWPGTAMSVQDDKGFFYYQFDADIKEVNFIFNNGTEQTADLWTDEDVCYTWSNSAELLLPDCEAPTAIDHTKEETYTLDLSLPMFNILGQAVDVTYQGIVIQNGHKFLR